MVSDRSFRLAAVLAATALLLVAGSARAVTTNGAAVTTVPTVSGWDFGWGATTATGWDYVGQVGGASGVYLGNNWVITAAHVGAQDYTIGGVTYSTVPGSTTAVTNTDGSTTDIILFQIATAPTLPALTVRTADPSVATYGNAGSTVVMIGYGGGKSWGANIVTEKNVNVTPQNTSYLTTDFQTKFGEVTLTSFSGLQSRTINNLATVVGGDSGGGDFIFDSTTSGWELAGINEARDDATGDSYLVQLSKYAAQINAIRTLTSVPEPSWTAVGGVAVILMQVVVRIWRRRQTTQIV